VAGEREQREKRPVAVVTQVENPGEPDGRVPRLVPIAVAVLALDQIRNAARHGWVRDLTGRHQREQRPGGLPGRAAGRFAMRLVRPIALAGFAPTAILALMRQQPRDGAADLRRGGVDTNRVERRQHRPGSVDVISTPAAEPAAVGLLLA